MLKTSVTACAMALLLAGAATAQSSKSNAGAAQGMVGVVTSEPGIASIAPSVSGKDAKGDSG